MSHHPRQRTLRAASIAVALGLFLVGSNFCLLSVLTGGDMACLSVPVAAGESRPPCHGPATGEDEAGGGASCCAIMAPVHPPEAPSLADVSGPAPVLMDAAIQPGPQAGMSMTPRAEHPPPPKAPTTHLEGRAPPLA